MASLTIQEKGDTLMTVLLEMPEDHAVFGVSKDVVTPLIKQGYLHADTYKYTGGAKLTKKGRTYQPSIL